MIVSIFASIAAGIMTWSFAEYAIHNWVGHLGRGRNDFSREHLAHHRDGNYFAATRKKIFMATAFMVGLAPLSILAVGFLYGGIYAGAFVATYVGYEVMHRRCHTHAPRGAYGRWVRKHHFYHHFGSPKMNHGVTSPIWDLVFRTYRTTEVVRVPERHAMGWLSDPATNEVWPKFAGDYVIARKQRRVPAAA